MDDNKDTDVIWLPVIGRALSFLCLFQAQHTRPEDFPNVLEKVKFLMDLGLPEADAAYTAGSNPRSVWVMKSRKKGGRRGHTKGRKPKSKAKG
jgi:hypothetical protein